MVPSVQEEVFQLSTEQTTDVDMIFPQEQVSEPVVELASPFLKRTRSARLTGPGRNRRTVSGGRLLKWAS